MCLLCLAAGVALAVILSGVRHISDTVFLEAAKVRNKAAFQSFRALDLSLSVQLPCVYTLFDKKTGP